MVEISDDEFDLDALMTRIREEVDRRRTERGAASVSAAAPGAAPADAIGAAPALRLLRVGEEAAWLDSAVTCHATDFLRYHDEPFLQCAYRAILRRAPDGAGFKAFLEDLRAGSKSRIEVLGRIRYSPEGRAVGTPIRGLALRFAAASIRRVPVIGGILASLGTIARLPRLAAAHEQLEAAYFRRDREIRRQLDVNAAAIEQQLNAIGLRVADPSSITRDDLARVERRIEALDAALAEIHRGAAGLHVAVSKKANAETLASLTEAMRSKAESGDLERALASLTGAMRSKAESGDLERALASLTEAMRSKAESADLERAVASLDGKADRADLDAIAGALDSVFGNTARRSEVTAIEERIAAVSLQLQAVLDQRRAAASARPISAESFDTDRHGSLYLDLENRFRGSPDDIAKRVEIYLPIVRSAGAGTPALPVLDLGCGRGEWLEVIARDGLAGYGVDMRESMVAESSSRDVRVELGDALEHLRSLGTSSLGAVTAFHVVEHLPFDTLLQVIDEAFRVLSIGGVLIMETPNPENLIVGGHTFYTDPTHVRPIPPALLHFAAEHAGFAEIETLRLHPRPEGDRLTGPDAAQLEPLNQLLFGPQDYAIVARKPDGGPGDRILAA